MKKGRDKTLRSTQNHEWWQSLNSNQMTYFRYYNRLVELSVSMFEWKNMPETVDIRYLELCLFGLGSAVFFKDEEVGYLALKCAATGPLDPYGIPTMRNGYSENGYNAYLTNEDSVIIWNNLIHTNSVLDVQYYSTILSELDQSIKVNLKAQKTPVMILCDEDQRLTMKNVYAKYDGNEPFIYGNKQLDMNKITVLKTDAPFLAKDLFDMKVNYWNEALTYLGITNNSVQKKERLITDEAIRGEGGTMANRYARLEARRMACRDINEMFGLDVWCDFREDYRIADSTEMIKHDTESAEREEVTMFEQAEGGDDNE